MQGGRRRRFEKQFATRANPASQWSINDKLSLYMPPVEDNYTKDNWLVDSDALVGKEYKTSSTLCILIFTEM